MPCYKYYIYILANYTNTVTYIGVTNNLARRIYEHKNKLIKGFTPKYNVTKLVYIEEYADIREAIIREKQLKHWRKEKKINLIMQQNPTFQDMYDCILS